MHARKTYIIFAAALSWALTPRAFSKGLDDLSQVNPENNPEGQGASPKASEEAGGEEGSGAHAASEGGSAPKHAEAPSALSKSLAQKLFMGTSFGWVKASRSDGTWKGSGTSDLTIGYKLPTSLAGAALAGTYRYVPIAVSGFTTDRDYRGIWELHYFGARANFTVKDGLSALASAELGYGMVHLRSTDGLPVKDADAKGGVSLALGGGADWHIGDKESWSAGPRVYVGFGGFTTIQVGGGASLMF